MRLMWKEIPATVVSLVELWAEHDENVIRQYFLPSEAVAIKRALESVEREEAHELIPSPNMPQPVLPGLKHSSSYHSHTSLDSSATTALTSNVNGR
jgi:hypothetical protein